MAKHLNRSERTIRRRLSNKYRSEKGYPTIDKKQVCQAMPKLAKSDWAAESRQLLDLGERELAAEVGHLFNYCGAVFRACCNIYWLPVELVGRRSLKRRFRAVVKQSDKGQN